MRNSSFSTFSALLKKRSAFFLFFLLGGGLFQGCTDIVQEDLSEMEVDLFAPRDSLRTTRQTITLNWKDLEGASSYNVQVAEPDFETFDRLVLDSTVERTYYRLNLPPGSYEWRVRGENNVSETPYSSRVLFIDSTQDISDLEVLLKGPKSGLRTNKTQFTFEWYELVGADHYRFKAEDPSGSLLFPSDTVQGTSYQKSGLGEGKIIWGVQGINQKTNTKTPYSLDTLVIDTSSPQQPDLISPSDNASLTDTVQHFDWKQYGDNGTPLYDSLFIATDTNLVNTVLSLRREKTGYSDSLGTGTFYWGVRVYDEAGNASPLSEVRKFTVQ